MSFVSCLIEPHQVYVVSIKNKNWLMRTQSVDEHGDVFTEVEYDNMSRPKKATNPYRTGETIYKTESFYDDLGRVTKIKTPDNAEVLTAYSLATTGANIGTVVTVKDQALKERRSIAERAISVNVGSLIVEIDN